MVFWAVMEYKKTTKSLSLKFQKFPCGAVKSFSHAWCFWWFVGQSYRKPQNFKWMLSQKHLNLIAYCHIYTRISTERPGVLPQTSTGSIIICAFWEMTHFIALQTTTSLDAALHSQACIFFSKCNKFLKVRLWKCPRAPQSDIYSRVTQSFFFFFFSFVCSCI